MSENGNNVLSVDGLLGLSSTHMESGLRMVGRGLAMLERDEDDREEGTLSLTSGTQSLPSALGWTSERSRRVVDVERLDDLEEVGDGG